MTEALIDSMEQSLRDYIESKSSFGNESRQRRLLHEIFKDFDVDRSGYVDLHEFEGAMARMNFIGCQSAVLDLFDRYDTDASGKISYEEFVEGVCGKRTMKYSSGREQRQQVSVIERVRDKIKSRAGKNIGIRGATRVLRQMDSDGSNSLSKEELQTGLLTYGVSTTPSELKTLMKYFDRDGSGKITIEEFLRCLRGSIGRKRKKLVRRAWDTLVKACKLDGAEDSISLVELSNFYDCSQNPLVISGQQTEEEALRIFMQAWDKDGDDHVTFKEFLDYYSDLSAGIEDDDYFELMIRNAWHISGGTGWCENTSNIRVLVTHYDGSQTVEELKNDFGLSRNATKEQLKGILFSQGIKDVSDVSMHY